MAPKITYWNRLEPRPRSSEIGRSLAAQIRDPLWMLTRQWQMGEFQGEDAGSPKFVQVVSESSPLSHFRLNPSEALKELNLDQPLERIVEAEPFTVDLSLRVELGRTFEMLLEAEGVSQVTEAFRQAYLLADKITVDSRDPEGLSFLRFCQNRALDGYALYEAAKEVAPSLPPQPVIDAALQAAVTQAVARFLQWVAEVFGNLGQSDAPAWRPSRLEYQLEMGATCPTAEGNLFSASPGRDGDFDWYAFDQRTSTVSPLSELTETRISVIPGYVRFRGMPNMRWWDFETNVTDFGAINPQKRDLAKLIVMDFMLIHGNDWFVVPLSQPVGTIGWVKSLLVHDVFGNLTIVERADADIARTGREHWTMFSTALENSEKDIAPVLIIPQSPASAAQFGAVIEEVVFFRDETAEMAWAVERITENAVGGQWSGHERDIAGRPPAAESSLSQAAAGENEPAIPLIYKIETTVPENWIPFVPVATDPAKGEILLAQAAMLRDTTRIDPVGRILQPAGLPVYKIEEEEVPRTGIVVSRVLCRSRWVDGSTHLWIARRKGPGTGEGSSSLRYDLALPNMKVGTD